MADFTDSLFDLTGRVALVTGGSRGIGRAISERLTQHGANVALLGRNLDTAQAVADAINARDDGRALPLATNITRNEELDAALFAVRAAFGEPDILVANAGLHIHFGPSADMSDAILAKAIDGNFGALHHLAQAMLPVMRAQNWGRIINIGSIAAHFGTGKYHSYTLSKALAMQYVRNLAVEHRPFGIRANTISPGLIRTDMARGLLEDADELAKELARSTTGGPGEPDDIVGMVVALASAAGNYVNGQTWAVDGGQTIRYVD